MVMIQVRGGLYTEMHTACWGVKDSGTQGERWTEEKHNFHESEEVSDDETH